MVGYIKFFFFFVFYLVSFSRSYLRFGLGFGLVSDLVAFWRSRLCLLHENHNSLLLDMASTVPNGIADRLRKGKLRRLPDPFTVSSWENENLVTKATPNVHIVL